MASIIAFFESIIFLVKNIVTSILWFVWNLPQLLFVLGDAINYAPPFLFGFLSLTVAATALFAILRLL